MRAARRTIYLKSQYFASISICEELAARLAEPDGPEVVVINPLSAFGWLEEHVMGSARDLRLDMVRRVDRYGRFGIFHPVNAAGEPIHVHAKVLVVDDRLIRIGSSNINNRSMGFDTECDPAIEASGAEGAAIIATMRDDLPSEHLDCDASALREAARECPIFCV
nr:phospholipase D-like domain-containing protein [uncultured Jannaschia sp.]